MARRASGTCPTDRGFAMRCTFPRLMLSLCAGALLLCGGAAAATAAPAPQPGQWVVVDSTPQQPPSTVYGHMPPSARQGSVVKAGGPTGAGSNGQTSGPHLHFEYWNGGRR
ncbi:M23 family metallopeptidase [Rhodococcus daqingensis]|uniref:M23 family metallopeptidase n=1 Tax=Rhodococcus daqingensis TaxID=2479363 RepID=A0ABW2S157_9NOCA